MSDGARIADLEAKVAYLTLWVQVLMERENMKDRPYLPHVQTSPKEPKLRIH
jgi:hypothetical protein